MELELGYVEAATDILSNPEDQEEYNKLIEECGLEGQKSITTDKDPIPFRALPTRELRAYKAILNTKTKLKDFKQEMIPLRVLGAIKIALDHWPIDELYVLHESNAVDPVVYRSKNNWSDEDTYFIGRWGKVLIDEPTLIKQATERLREKARAAVENLSVDKLVQQHLEGKSTCIYPFS